MPTSKHPLTKIGDLLSRRTDLSTFVVHLTRKGEDGMDPQKNLRNILSMQVIEARSPFGPAAGFLQGRHQRKDLESQHCVSLSETPLEHLHCLVHKIPRRRYRLSSFGLAFTKMVARRLAVNPVWYIDITPGHDWLTKPIDAMIEREIKKRKRFRTSPLAQLCPFIEQMGSGYARSGHVYRKEFWWEREWRHRGDFSFGLSDAAFGLAPSGRISLLEKFTSSLGRTIRFIDPKWNMERMIAHLAGHHGGLTPFD